MSRQRWLVLVSQKRSLRHCCPSKLLAYRSVVVPVMEMYTIKRGIFLGSTAPLIPLLILALYISFACNIVCFLSFFSSLFPYLCFLWEYTHSVSRPEVARGDQTWAFLVVLAYFKLQYFVLLMHDCLCSVSLGLVYIFVVISNLTNTGKTIILCWIPSHVNIRGNERADTGHW